MKDSNYFVIQGWMHNELGLTGHELLVYAIIYGFSQDNESVYSGSTRYITDTIGISKRTVFDVFSKLVDKGYIVRIENTINGVKFVNYRAVKPAIKPCAEVAHPMQNLHTPYAESAQPPMQNLHTDNNNINNINNNTPVFRNTIPEGNTITQYCPQTVSPTGDVLGDKRPIGANDLPRPKKSTKPEDYGLVKFDIDDIQEGDWERLLNWFEYHHRDHATGNVLRPYCQKMFKQYVSLLKNLSNECWFYAVDCIEGAVNKGYQGFADSTRFYFEAKPLDDYETELKFIRGFTAAPRALPEHLSRYKPKVYDEAIKYFQHWIEQTEQDTTRDPERRAFDLKNMTDELNWVLEQKTALQTKKNH